MTTPTPISKYADFRVTADAIVFCFDEHGDPHVLLIERGKDPFRGAWCFPGGHVDRDEDLVDAAVRELREETGLVIDPSLMRQVGAYGKPGRDPRGQYVTVAFSAVMLGTGTLPPIAGDDDATAAVWKPLSSLHPDTLGFDHGQILHDAIAKRMFGPNAHDIQIGKVWYDIQNHPRYQTPNRT